MYGETYRSSEIKQSGGEIFADTYKVIRGVGKAAYTLFNVPEHDFTKSRDLAAILEDVPQETLPPLDLELENIRHVLAEQPLRAETGLNRSQLLGLTGVLMQFTSYLPELRPYAQTPFINIDKLYTAIVEAGESQPLDLSQQLDIALNQTSGDVGEALWRLFVTSRMHGRWYDAGIIQDLPDMSREDVMERMGKFSRAIKACKEYSPPHAQDTAGDAYYVWTHALGKFAFHTLAEKNGLPERVGGRALHNGTALMHGLAHRFKEQHVISDHTVAAQYGNEIGAACIEIFEQSTFEQPRAA